MGKKFKTKVTKSNKGGRECSQKLMSLYPIFSLPIFSSTDFSILHISYGSDNLKVTRIKSNPRNFACACYNYITRSKVTFCQCEWLVPVYLCECKLIRKKKTIHFKKYFGYCLYQFFFLYKLFPENRCSHFTIYSN